ncbi:hypothetical protein BU15DRAFT_74749 [Melanogaster broomeanus]|nr:hypothetical protein BU15DRAFT_74749 [Melanogaster broomeanus]
MGSREDLAHLPRTGTRDKRAPAEAFSQYKSLLGSPILIMRDNLHSTTTFSGPSTSGSSSSSATTLPSQPNSSEVPRKTAFCGRTQSKDFEAAFATLASSYGGLGIVGRVTSA